MLVGHNTDLCQIKTSSLVHVVTRNASFCLYDNVPSDSGMVLFSEFITEFDQFVSSSLSL
jgi:hypothetical protein